MTGRPAIFAPLLLAAVIPVSYADSRTDQVNALFKTFDRADVPGCGLGIIQDGRFIYKRGYGMANLDYGIPILPETVFRIGSVSKQFTAMAIALAAAEGKLSLDNDVREHLPELRNLPAPITIRQMLYHSSGIRDYLELMDLAGNPSEDDYYTVEEAVAMIARQKHLNFPPGRRVSVQQLRVLSHFTNHSSGDREEPPRVGGREDLPAFGNEEHPLPRRPADDRSEPRDRVSIHQGG